MRFSLLLILSLLLGTAPWARAEQPSPIQIESDRMESGEGENTILFTGGVVARQGELVIHAERMTIVYLSEEEKAQLAPESARRLKKLSATGNVKLETAAWIGTGARMDYFEVERKVYLSGEAKVWRGNNLVTGEAVTIHLDEGKSIVERSEQPGERVRAFFYSSDEQPPRPVPDDTPPGTKELPAPDSTLGSVPGSGPNPSPAHVLDSTPAPDGP